MNRYKVELPDKRVLTIEAPDPETATRDADAWFAQNSAPKPNETSFFGSLARGAGQGLLAGFGDEAEAMIRAGLDPNKTYDDIIPEVRQKLAQSQEEFPVTTYGAEIASSIALPMGLAAKGIGYTAKAAGQGLGATMKAGLKEGALYGAAYGAGKSEGGIEDRAEGALGGGLIGGAVGGVAPAVVAGGGAIADSIRSNVNKMRNPLDEATRTVAKTAIASDENAALMKAMGRSPVRIDGNQDAVDLINRGAAGQDVMLVDTMGESGRRLLRSATNNSPEGREMAEAVLYPRSEGQTSRAVDFIKGLTGRQGNAGQTADDLKRWGQITADPVYKAAREAGDRPLWSRNLEQLTGSDMMRAAMQKAAKSVNDRSIAEGYGAMNVGVSFENGVMKFTTGANGRTAYPNLAFWDETKRNLDTIVGEAKTKGDKNTVAIGTKMLTTLRDELDSMVPEYKNARGIAANYFKADNALEAGQKFASGKYDFHEVEKMLADPKVTALEKGMFQEGFVAKYLDDISGTKDRRDLTKILMGDANARRAFEVALGKTKARQLEAFLHIEKVMEASKGALGNSTTAQQLKDMGAAGVITGIGGGALQGGYFDPTAAIMGAVGKYGVNKAKSNIDNRFAQNIVAVLTSKDPKQVNLAMQQLSTPDNLATLRRITAGITGAGAAVGGSMSAQTEDR
jgi:hypothetical protein